MIGILVIEIITTVEAAATDPIVARLVKIDLILAVLEVVVLTVDATIEIRTAIMLTTDAIVAAAAAMVLVLVIEEVVKGEIGLLVKDRIAEDMDTMVPTTCRSALHRIQA